MTMIMMNMTMTKPAAMMIMVTKTMAKISMMPTATMTRVTCNHRQRRPSKLEPGMSQIYTKRIESLKLPTLQYRRYRDGMIEVFKLSHGYYDRGAVNNFMYFLSNVYRENRFGGHNYNIYKERYKKDSRQYSFKGRVTEQFTRKKIVNAPYLNACKSRLDKLWGNKDVIFDPDVDINTATSVRNTRYAEIDVN